MSKCVCGHDEEDHHVLEPRICTRCDCKEFRIGEGIIVQPIHQDNPPAENIVFPQDDKNESLISFTKRKIDKIIDLLERARDANCLMQFSINDTLLPVKDNSKLKCPVIQINVVIDEMFLNKFEQSKLELQ